MSIIPNCYDVAIVGAGPSGLTLALEMLLQPGSLSILVIDANKIPCGGSKLPKGQGINSRTMEIWKRYGLDGNKLSLAEKIKTMQKTPEGCFPHFLNYNCDDNSSKTNYQPDGSLYSPEASQRVQQPLYEECLRSFLRDKVQDRTAHRHKVDIRYGYTCTSMEQSDNKWVIEAKPSVQSIGHYSEETGGFNDEVLKGEDEHPEVFRASYIVGADGGRSFIRRSLGIKYSGIGSLGAALTVVFTANNLLPYLKRTFPDFNGLFYTFTSKKYGSNAIGILEKDTFYSFTLYKSKEDAPEWARKGGPDMLQRAMESLKERLQIKNEEVFKNWQPTEAFLWSAYCLSADSWMNDGVALVGDAAHLLSPAGGLGMNAGVADSCNLGWKLSLYLRGIADEKLLHSYETERRLAYKRYSEFNQAAFKALGERDLTTIHQVVFGPALDCVQVGERAPHVVMRDGRSIFELFSNMKFTLLCTVDDPEICGCFSDWAQEKHLEFNIATLKDDANVKNLYKGEVTVIRPDQFVSYHGDAEELKAIIVGARCVEWLF